MAISDKAKLIDENQNEESGIDTKDLLKKETKSSCCNMTPFVLMIALSVHAIFEGLALGLQ